MDFHLNFEPKDGLHYLDVLNLLGRIMLYIKKNEEVANSLSRTEELIGWENLQNILQIMWILIEK